MILPAMRRLARHAFTILSAISLLLCVAVCVLWIGSYWWTATINRYSRDYDGDALLTLQASAARGRVVISRRYWARGGDAKVEYAVSYAGPEPDPDRRIAGFGVDPRIKLLPTWSIRVNRRFLCLAGPSRY